MEGPPRAGFATCPKLPLLASSSLPARCKHEARTRFTPFITAKYVGKLDLAGSVCSQAKQASSNHRSQMRRSPRSCGATDSRQIPGPGPIPPNVTSPQRGPCPLLVRDAARVNHIISHEKKPGWLQPRPQGGRLIIMGGAFYIHRVCGIRCRSGGAERRRASQSCRRCKPAAVWCWGVGSGTRLRVWCVLLMSHPS